MARFPQFVLMSCDLELHVTGTAANEREFERLKFQKASVFEALVGRGCRGARGH